MCVKTSPARRHNCNVVNHIRLSIKPRDLHKCRCEILTQATMIIVSSHPQFLVTRNLRYPRRHISPSAIKSSIQYSARKPGAVLAYEGNCSAPADAPEDAILIVESSGLSMNFVDNLLVFVLIHLTAEWQVKTDIN